MPLFKKTNPRRDQVRKTITPEKSWLSRMVDADLVTSLLIWLIFVLLCVLVSFFELVLRREFDALLPICAVVLLTSMGMGVYIYHYQVRMIRNHARAVIMTVLFVLFLIATKVGVISANSVWATGCATGTAVMVAIILTIAYDQRFAIEMGIFYSLYVCLALSGVAGEAYQISGIYLFFVMVTGVVSAGFSLREIRTRMKLLEVSTLTASMVFVMAVSVGCLAAPGGIEVLDFSKIIMVAGYHAAFAFIVGLVIHSFLPLLEKLFRIATSMTLLDYSDANQPLLKKLVMDAPGTFSHSLLIGSIAETAADAIGCNGLLCRVGAYYHDIGKLNKPSYFIENQGGTENRHKELSPTMSQLIIVGHVKDGIEMAKEYKLPVVLRQFIATHHGTTLIEPFFNQAKKKHEAPTNGGPGQKPKEAPPSESEFRYAGPKPETKEAAIVMLADSVEGAVRSLAEVTPSKVETVVHNMAMKRLQDGQFDECDITLRELSRVEAGISKALAGHYHGRIAYPNAPDDPDFLKSDKEKEAKDKGKESSKARDDSQDTGSQEKDEKQRDGSKKTVKGSCV
jgi:cyclic-di-AMP phosphodiesterase PgpH